MNLTPLMKPVFKHRVKKIDRYATGAESIQREVLARLVKTAASTEWGIKHNYSSSMSYEQFVANVEVQNYETLKGYIDRMRHGEKDVLWKGRCKWYAKSSGTTNDKKDVYFAGYTPDFVACCWYGYDLNQVITTSGNSAASLWNSVFDEIYKYYDANGLSYTKKFEKNMTRW